MAWWLSLALCALFFIGSPVKSADSTRIGFSVGLISTNWHQMLSAGIVQQTSPRWAKFAFADIGGGLASFQGQTALLFPMSETWSAAFFVGPEISVYQHAPTLEQQLVYLSAATGGGVYLRLVDRGSLLISAEYIKSNAPISRFRLGLRGIIWLN